MRYSPFVTVGQGEMTVGRASASSGRSHAEPRRRSLEEEPSAAGSEEADDRPVLTAEFAAPRLGGWVALEALEGIGGDPRHKIPADRGGGGAARLAPRLVLEAREKLRPESQTGKAGEHLRPRVRRELLRPPSDCLPACGHL